MCSGSQGFWANITPGTASKSRIEVSAGAKQVRDEVHALRERRPVRDSSALKRVLGEIDLAQKCLDVLVVDGQQASQILAGEVAAEAQHFAGELEDHQRVGDDLAHECLNLRHERREQRFHVLRIAARRSTPRTGRR